MEIKDTVFANISKVYLNKHTPSVIVQTGDIRYVFRINSPIVIIRRSEWALPPVESNWEPYKVNSFTELETLILSRQLLE